jgi:hypothetical protein
MALADGLLELATLAGQTVVKAAVTDAWESARRGFARVLGRGDPGRAELAERRLDETRAQILAVPEPDRERAGAELEAVWRTRLADLLEEYPELAGELTAVVREVGSEVSVASASASGHAVAAGRDLTVNASGGSVAAAVIHGNVSPANPTEPGPATS